MAREVPKQMTAAVLVAHGGPSAIEVRTDVPVPTPGPGEVLVEVAAAAVNNTDIWTREGAYGRPGDPDAVAGWRGEPIDVPRIQGADVAGYVASVGDGVDDELVGRRVLVDPAGYDDDAELVAVMGSESDGGFAEFVAVPASKAHEVTGSPLSDVELACLPIAYGTAIGMLDRAGLTSGERILVTGASGGVGLALVQLAAGRDAHVTALTSPGHEATLREAGAEHVVDRTGDPGAGAVVDATGGEFDVVADVVGGWVVPALLDALGSGGRWVTAGAIAGPVVELDMRRLYLRNRLLIGSTMHTADQFEGLVAEAVAGRVAPRVERVYPLEEIHAAQERFAAGNRTGKIVLVPGRERRP